MCTGAIDLEAIHSHVHEDKFFQAKGGVTEANINPWRNLIFGMSIENQIFKGEEVWKEEHHRTHTKQEYQGIRVPIEVRSHRK